MKRIAIITLATALTLSAHAGVRPIDPKTDMPEAPVHYYIAAGITTRPPVQGWHDYQHMTFFGPWRSMAACQKWVDAEKSKHDNHSWNCEPVHSTKAVR